MANLLILLAVLLVIRLLWLVFKSKKISLSFNKILGVYFFAVLFTWSLTRFIKYNQIPYFLIRPLEERIRYFKDIFESQIVPPEFFPFCKYIPVLLSFILLIALFFVNPLSDFFKKITNTKVIKIYNTPLSNKGIFISILIILAVLIIKEIINPFFFVHDDNHNQFLPKTVLALNILFSGHFPFIDNYQHFGSLLFEIGTYPIFEPFILISYLISRFIFNNPYLMFELYAAISLSVGAIFLGLSMKMLKIDQLTGISAIISFFICGYFFIAGRSWFYVLSIASYLPILLYFFLLFLNKQWGWKWFLGLSILRGCFFYAGNSQFFIYGVGLEFFSYLFLFIKEKKFRSTIPFYFLSLFFTFALCLPVIIPQFLLLRNDPRSLQGLMANHGIPFDALISSFLPYPFTRTPHPVGWPFDIDGNKRFMTNMYHIGFVWMITYFCGLIFYIRKGKSKFDFLIVASTLLLLFSAGYVSLFYFIKEFIPVISKMHFPFKLYPYAMFLIILYGALTLTNFRKQNSTRKVIGVCLVANMVITVLVGILATNTAFHMYGEKPYPKLNKIISDNVTKDDLVYGYAILRTSAKPYVTYLPHNYSCLFDLMCVNVYDPLLPTMISLTTGDPDAKLDFKKLGITKIIFQKLYNSTDWYKEAAQHVAHFPKIYEGNDFILYKTDFYNWIIKPVNNNEAGSIKDIEQSRTELKATINVHENSKWLYHNEYRSGYQLKVNGKKAKIMPSKKGWCSFNLLPGENKISIFYITPKFISACMIGISLIIFSIVLFNFLYNKNPGFKKR